MKLFTGRHLLVAVLISVVSSAAGALSGPAASPTQFCERDGCYWYSICFDTGVTWTGCDMQPTGLCKVYQCAAE